MNCKVCGSIISEESKFCPGCGKPVAGNDEPIGNYNYQPRDFSDTSSVNPDNWQAPPAPQSRPGVFEDEVTRWPMISYILYLVSLMTGFTSIIGVIIAYVYKDAAPDWLQSHYTMIIRTFWIGLLYSFVSFILCFVIVGFVLLLGTVIWFVVRCVKGMQYLANRQPYQNPTTWWI